MAHCLIGLGANLADRHAGLERAVQVLVAEAGIRVVALSTWHETNPAGGPPDQPAFLNGAMLLETALSPNALLDLLLRTEDALGRVRNERWGPRTLDLDLLLYDQLVVESLRLVLPHPRMSFRRFVLAPAVEIAPTMLHPSIGWTIKQLFDHLVHARPYVAFVGPPGAGKGATAEIGARESGARFVRDPVAAGKSDRPDTAGRKWQVEIEFLERRRQLLDQGQWPVAGGQGSDDGTDQLTGKSTAEWTVSDFWFDQSRAYASVLLDNHQRAELERLWQVARTSVVPPKLLVLLDERKREPLESVTQEIAERADISDAIRELAMRPGHGPVLRLSGLDARRAADEIMAAMQAMEY